MKSANSISATASELSRGIFLPRRGGAGNILIRHMNATSLLLSENQQKVVFIIND